MQIKTWLIDKEKSFLNGSSTLSRPHQEWREDPHSNTEEKGRRKEKTTNYTGDRQKMNHIKGTRDLVPTREKTFVKNLLSLRTNRHGGNRKPSIYVGYEQDGRQKKFDE